MLYNFHTHTYRCKHASGEDKEYVEAAIQAGFQTLGFSDHCPCPFSDGYVSNIRMLPSEMEHYFSSIECLKAEYANDIKIYAGFEAEYVPALDEAQRRLFAEYPVDYLILGQHFLGVESESSYTGMPTTDETILKQYVDLVLEAMNTGRYLYLAHPDLIHYIGPDSVYEKHISRLCHFFKENNIPLEINILGLRDKRHYPCDKFLKIAGRTGNTVVLGMDAHAPEQLLQPDLIKQAESLCETYQLTIVEPII